MTIWSNKSLHLTPPGKGVAGELDRRLSTLGRYLSFSFVTSMRAVGQIQTFDGIN